MIQGLIKANRDGFKNTSKQKGIENVILTVKSDKPTKFKKRQIAFDATHFKNPAPTPFRTEQIKENTYTAKEFNKLNYSEDPFKELFGYTKRINPDDNINPKFYEYKLGNKNENTFILENLQAENGTATNDVEQREALKDFLELRRQQEEEDAAYEAELEPLDEYANKQKMGKALKKWRRKAAAKRAPTGTDLTGADLIDLPATITTRTKSSGKKARSISIEPAMLPVDKFKEFEEKTNIGNVKLIGSKVPKGDIPTIKEFNDLAGEIDEYLEGTSKDRSAVIKLNKYLKAFGIQPITGKEVSYSAIKPKVEEFLTKLIVPQNKKYVAGLAETARLKKTDGLKRLEEDEVKRNRYNKINALVDKAERDEAKHEAEEKEAYESISKGRRPSARKIFSNDEDAEAFEDYLERERSRADEERVYKNKMKGARFLARTVEEVLKRNKLKPAFDKLKENSKQEKSAIILQKSLRRLSGKRQTMQEAHRLNETGVDIETINPQQANAQDTEIIKKSLGAPEDPANKKVLEDIVKTLRPILNNAYKTKLRKIPSAYITYINSLFKANEELQTLGVKPWRRSSNLSRLEQVLNTIERKISGKPDPPPRGVGRPRTVVDPGDID